MSDKDITYYQDLIIRKFSDSISESEHSELTKWIDQSEENQKEYQRFELIWNQSSTISVDTEKAWKNISSQISESKIIPLNKKPIWYSVAASIVFLLGVTFLFFNQQEETFKAISQVEVVNLPDQSIIDLNQGSILSYSDDFNEDKREVNLSGEAFFDVERNPEKPFIIHTDLIDVSVLGTSFFVKENADSVIVSVVSGKVKVENRNISANELLLEVNESAIFLKNEQLLEKQTIFEYSKFKWREKLFVFNNASLQKVVRELNRAYQTNIEFENEELKKCRLTATFKDQSLDEIVEILKATFDLQITTNEESIKLNGEKCN